MYKGETRLPGARVGRSEPELVPQFIDGVDLVGVSRYGPSSIEFGETASPVAADRLGRTAVRVEDRHLRRELDRPSDIDERGLGILPAQIQTRTRQNGIDVVGIQFDRLAVVAQRAGVV